MAASCAAVVAAGVALQACAGGAGIERATLRNMADAEEALVMPPPGGPAIVGVTQRVYTNAIDQEIALSSDTGAPGQNMMRVQIFGPVGGRATTAFPDRPLAIAFVSREMRQALPGIRMERSAFYAQNSYGPFGYAIGRYGSRDLCIYAWQRIAGTANAVPMQSAGAIEVRLRMCRQGATEQALLATMYGYTVAAALPGAGWNPYGSPPPPDPRLGELGQPIAPATPLGPANVLAAQETAPVRPAVPARRAASAAPAVERPVVERVTDEPGGPLVPPPPGLADEVVVPAPPG